MKKIISLILCITLFSPLLLISANADTAITKNEAAELITKMADFHYILAGLDNGGYIARLPGTKVTDKETFDRLLDKSGLYPSEDLIFYLCDGEYGKASYWYERVGEFLTEDYVKKNIEFNRAIHELDGKIYHVDGAFYMTAPGYPVLVSDGDEPLEDHIKIVDTDTVLLEGFFDDRQWMPVDFEYTENGWRISGGEGTKRFMRFASHSIKISEAEDLIRQMVSMKGVISSDGDRYAEYIFVGDLPSTPVSDKALLKQLHEISRLPDYMRFYKLDGEYGKASFWFDRLKKFLTDEYIDENLMLTRTLWQIGDDVYTPEGIGYASAPNFPYMHDDIGKCITKIDNDTVLLEAEFHGYEPTKYRIDFEYTENGWRISGGEGAKRFLGRMYKEYYQENPETGDDAVIITVCMTVSVIGIAYGVNKRRFAKCE